MDSLYVLKPNSLYFYLIFLHACLGEYFPLYFWALLYLDVPGNILQWNDAVLEITFKII